MASNVVKDRRRAKLSTFERSARDRIGERMMREAGALMSDRSGGVAFRFHNAIRPEVGRFAEGPRAKAAERLACLVHGWESRNGTMSVEELMGLCLVGLGEPAQPRGPASARDIADETVARSTVDLLWQCVSMEHALVWKFCDEDDEMRTAASAVAASRSVPAETIRRALNLYLTMLAQNLRARGVPPERVVTFVATKMRPMNPVLPEGVRMADVDDARWIDRRPSTIAAELAAEKSASEKRAAISI